MPRTVVWPSSPGHAGPSLILPHASHPQTTPLILDNRLVALTTPAPQPVPTSNQDCKQRRGAQQQTQQATLVKLEDSPITGKRLGVKGVEWVFSGDSFFKTLKILGVCKTGGQSDNGQAFGRVLERAFGGHSLRH